MFQIGSNENGWSKILTLGTYKTLAFTLRKEKTPWLPLSERVYHFLEIYVLVVIPVLLMFINASPDSRSLDMVNLGYVFNLLSVLNEHSHSADVIGNVHKMRIKVWMLGKNLSIACCECLNCTCGKVGILSAAPLSLPSQELNINHMRRRKVVLIKLQRCFNVRISVSDGYQLRNFLLCLPFW